MSFESAKEYLEKRGYKDRIITFDVSTATVELAAKALGTQECRIAKTLGFIIQDTPLLIVMAGDVRVDNKKYKQTFHEKAHMLSYESSTLLVGHAPGGVCPFGVNEKVKIYLDESLKRFESVFPAVGSSNSAIELKISELEELLPSATWVDVAKL